jgi:hypothetical protein
MVTLTRPTGSSIHQSFPSGAARTRFFYWAKDAAATPVTLAKAWTDGGVFVVAPGDEAEADILRFAQDVWDLYGSAEGKIVAWKKGQQSPPPYLRFKADSTFEDGNWGSGLLQYTIGTNVSDRKNLFLLPARGAVFSGQVTSSGLRFVSPNDIKAPFTVMMGGFPMDLEWQRPAGQLPSVMELLVTDQSDESGSWRFVVRSVATRKFLNAAPPIIRYMDARMDLPPYPCFDLDAKESELEKSPITALVHPYVLDASHTRFALNKDMALVSQFLDTAGRQVELKTTDSARFRFLRNPKNTGADMHMSPVGEFGVGFKKTRGGTVKGAGAQVMEVMTGLNGTDFVVFGDGSNALPSRIQFVTDRPAFLPSGQSELNRAALTAWVVPFGDGASSYDYVSQPEEAPLFALKDVKDSRNVLTGLRDTPGMEFDPAPTSVSMQDQTKAAMPWIPVRTLNPNGLASTRSFEKRVLGQTRRRIASLARAPEPMRLADSPPPLRWVVMPQGFSVALDPSNKWKEVVFAVASGDVNATLRLQRPKKDGVDVEQWPVEESLARSSTFLVASRFPESMPSPGGGTVPDTPFEAELEVARWKVRVDFASSRMTSARFAEPLVVVKLGGAKSVIDLMSATSSWSLPEVFNADPAVAAKELKKSVEGIKSLADGITPLFKGGLRITDQARDAYRTLREKLTDPEWNGVVVFNAASGVTDLPEDVAALSGGLPEKVEKEGFWVPCLGVDLAKVQESSGGARANAPMQVPSVFAGIHYFDEEELETDVRAFGVKLKNLDVTLNNSALQMFVAKAQLRVSTLMGIEASDAPSQGGKNRLIRIEGSYQGKSPEGTEQYLIRALGAQTIAMQTKEVIERIQITRLELGSRKEQTTVHGRIGLWGEITFGSSIEEATGAKSVRFENLSISMVKPKGGDASFKFDAGHVAVDWDKPASGPGWLKEFPIKLSGFRWGGADFALPSASWPKMMELPEFGFTKFDFGKLMPSLPTGGRFDFGLEFDIDLGSFGSMTDATQLLRSKVLFGWPGFGRLDPGAFAIGFKFEGGSGPLDIGIQGILRLRAKKVILKQYAAGKLLGIGLIEPQLDALGYQIPDNPANLEMALVIETGSPNNMPTWVVSLGDGASAGPVELDYLAFGQNVLMLDPGNLASVQSASDAVAKSKDWLKEKFKAEQLDQLRPKVPSGKWNLVASGQIKSNVADFKLAFLDDISVYGLRVDAPIQASWIGLDILYKKLEDDLGVFSIEVDLKGLRNIELGAGSLTLPPIGFEKFSNGDWSINFAFLGNDFSKAGTFQMLPFLGSASLKLGQLSGRSSQFLVAGASSKLLERYRRLDLKPVYEIQTAFRFGFGKQIQQGILSAGASLTIYGIFQGSLGKATKSQSAGMQYIKVAGAAGILLEVFGEVNFAVISAAVCIRAWIETGIIAETWEEIAIYAEAGVSVYVRFVVARFRIFGRKIEIAIHFSFSTRLRIGATLPLRIGGTDPEARPLALAELVESWPDPLSWVPERIGTGDKLTLPIMVSMDAHLDDAGRPVLSPVLAVVNPFPQGMPPLPGESVSDLVIAAFTWAVRVSLGLACVNPVSVTHTELRRLQRQMRSPEGLSASRWRVKMPSGQFNRVLDAAEIRDFLTQNVQFTLMTAGSAKSQLLARMRSDSYAQLLADNAMPGISVPWLKELRLSADGGNRLIRDFADAKYLVIDEAWEAKARGASGKGRPVFDALDPSRNAAIAIGALASTASGKVRSLLDVVLEDWFVAMLEGAIHRAIAVFDEAKEEKLAFAVLIQSLRTVPNGAVASPAVEVVQHAAAVLVHAQRLPLTGGGWTSLPAMAGLDVPFGPEGIQDTDTSVLVEAPAAWNCDPVTLTFEDGIDGQKAFAALQAASAEVKAAGVELTIEQARMTRTKEATFTGALGLAEDDGIKRLGALYEIPGALRQLQMREPGSPPTEAIAWKFSGIGSEADKRDLTGDGKELLNTKAKQRDDMYVGGTFRFKLRRLYSQAPAGSLALSGAAQPGALPGIYGLAGGGESARLVLSSWMNKLSDLAPKEFALLWNPVGDGKVPDPRDPKTMHRIVDKGVRFFATNLSTEANPDAAAMARLARADTSTIADISNPEAVREFLWKATLVNGEGFFIHVDTVRSPQLVADIESLLDIADSVDLPLAWLRPAFESASGDGKLHPYESHLFVKAVLPERSTVVVEISGQMELANSVPPGFVKLSVQRDNPAANPAVEMIGDDAREFLSRYAFLEWGIKDDKFPAIITLQPDESSPAPVDEPEGLDKSRTLEVQQPPKFTHTLLLPLLQLAKENRNPDGTLKDSQARNPFAAIGADVQRDASFCLRDESGHRFPFGVRSNFPAAVRQLYSDSLQRLDAYPGVALKWSASASGAICRLKLSLTWAMKLEELKRLPVDRRANFVQQFLRLGWLVRGPATKVIGRAMVGSQVLAFDKSPIDLAGDIAQFAAKVARLFQTPPTDPKDPEVKVSMAATFDVKSAEFKRVLQVGAEVQLFRAEVVIERDPSSCDRELVGHDPSIQISASAALPDVKEGTRQQWADFANAFEAAVKDGNQPAALLLRLQDGTADQSCWLTPPASLANPLGAKRAILSYAPRPLAMEFASGEAHLLGPDGLPPVTPQTKPVNEADLDDMAQRSLDVVEAILAPAVSARMCVASPASFDRIVRAKRRIAQWFSEQLSPIEEANSKANCPAVVKKKFADMALADLRHVYRIGAVCDLLRDDVNGPAPASRVYGDLKLLNPVSDAFEFTKLRLPTRDAASAPLVVFWKGSRRIASVEGSQLNFEPRYIEVKWLEGNGGIGDYIPSRWFELMSAKATQPKAIQLTGGVSIPLPLRQLPKPAHIYGQDGTATYGAPKTLTQARAWKYRLHCAVPGEEQDKVTFSIRYQAGPTVNPFRSSSRSLFDVLVTFEHYSALLASSMSQVQKWDMAAAADAAVVECERLANFVEDLAKGFAEHVHYVAVKSLSEPQVDTLTSTIVRVQQMHGLASDGRAQRDRIGFITQVAAAGSPNRTEMVELVDSTRLVDGGLPADVNAQSSTPIVGPEKDEEGYSEYYDQDKAVTGLSGLSGRRLTMDGLDLFLHATVTPEIFATRNEKLGKVPVSKEFVFTTSVSSSTRLVPRLRATDRIALAGRKTLKEHLSAMAAELFDGSVQPLSVDAFAKLRIPYRAGQPEGYTYPVGAMKGCSARPGEWAALFEQWSAPVQVEVSAKSQDATPGGISIEISVYADGYAGSRPVLTVKEVWIPWAMLVPAAPTFGTMPLAVARPQDLAALLFALTKDLGSPQRGVKAEISAMRAQIASLVKANVPSMNVLTVGPLPTVEECKDERLKSAWADCVDAAANARAFAGRRATQAAFWSLEPVNLGRNGYLPAHAWTGAESMKFKSSSVQVQQQGKSIPFIRTGESDGQEGDVALFVVYPDEQALSPR